MENDRSFNRGARARTAAFLAVAGISYLAGSLAPPVRAEVTPGQPRTTFLDGGVIANETLQQQLAVLKRLDERIARIEKALLEAVEK
jgi:hypothetical protein